jgi:inosose dehydratase
MKTAINACTWNAYAGFVKKPLTAELFFREAAEAGYDGVEVGGGENFLGKPSDCLKLAEKNGLEICAYATSLTYNPWKPSTESFQADVRYAVSIGMKTLMMCGGFIPSPRRNTYPFDYDMFAGNLGRAMAFAKKHGCTIAFHPHRGCIVETLREAQEMVKRLPKMQFCVDTAHLESSGDDALRFCKVLGKRIIYTHLKDYSWKLDSFTELGKGGSKLDVSACVKELKRQGYDGWLTVELDKKFGEKDRTPLESARLSRKYLKTQCGV